MQVWTELTTQDIILTLEKELAKANNELRCSLKDTEKASNRIAFIISAIHALKDRDME